MPRRSATRKVVVDGKEMSRDEFEKQKSKSPILGDSTRPKSAKSADLKDEKTGGK